MPSHLEEFMKKLKEQDDDTIFSTPPEENIQVIPPEKSSQTIQVDEPKDKPEPLKVIPPETEKPKSYNFKINVKKEPVKQEIKQAEKQPAVIISKPPEKQVEQQEIIKPKQESNTVSKPIENKPQVKSQAELDKEYAEMLFKQFDKAKKSTKSNYVVDKMKRGKFMLNNDGQLLFLPEHETYGKSSGDLLTEHWL